MMKQIDQKTDNNGTGASIPVLVFRYGAPFVILALGVLVMIHLMNTSPRAKPGGKRKQQTIVQVEPATFTTHTTEIIALGNVIASQQIELKPQVSGEVLEISPSLVAGGFFKKDERLLEVDDTDYRIELLELESDLATARSGLEIEMGNQRIARKEYQLLGEEAAEDEKRLMLRSPQLLQQKAAVEAAQARVAKGKLNLQRTHITAPFNGVTIEQGVNIGAQVNTSSTLATLAGTDTFWVELAVPVEKLQWINLPGNSPDEIGSGVKIFTDGDAKRFRAGRVIRMAADLESKGRMARVYVEVEDPLCLQQKNHDKDRLFLGSYVKAAIEGKEIDRVIYLSRSQLRDNDTVWLYGEDATLIKKRVDVLFRGNEFVLVRGLDEGAKLIVSNIAAPVEGMMLALEGETLPPGGEKGTGSGSGQGKQGKGGPNNG